MNGRAAQAAAGPRLRPAAADLRTVTLRCPDDLTPQAEEWLTAGLAAALPSLRMRSLFQARMDMFREAELITVALDGQAVVGALSSRWSRLPSGLPFLHITTQFVAETHRHGMVFRASWRQHFEDMLTGGGQFPGMFVLKTYNPVVYCAMRAFTGAPGVTMYPVVTGAQDEAMTATAAQVAAVVSPEHPFEPGSGVIRGAGLPADLYPELPRSRDEAVNSYFDQVTQPGDRILCVLRVQGRDGADVILSAFGLSRES